MVLLTIFSVYTLCVADTVKAENLPKRLPGLANALPLAAVLGPVVFSAVISCTTAATISWRAGACGC